MTLEELQDLLAEQFSCDVSELDRSTALTAPAYSFQASASFFSAASPRRVR